MRPRSFRFRDVEEVSHIKFGTMKDRDPKLDIRSGQLKLAGYALVLEAFFY